MGWLRHKAIIINGLIESYVKNAHALAVEVYGKRADRTDDEDFSGLVSPVIRHELNTGASFFISPDGSKEGWLGSDVSDEKLTEFIRRVKEIKSVDYAVVLMGGDADEFGVLESAGIIVNVTRKEESAWR